MNLTSSSLSKTILIWQDIEVREDVIVENGATLHFCGGRFVNKLADGQTIAIKGDDITIIAGPEWIFVGNFEFFAADGETAPAWTMECAYPQWFGAKSCADNITASEIDDALDASEAINAAIRLKRVGRVMIPAGFYKITRFINVLPGIILEGETPRFSGVNRYGTVLFPWHNLRTEGEDANQIQTRDPKLPTRDRLNINNDSATIDVACMDFPLHPNDVDWYNQEEFSSSYDSGYMMLACMSDKCTVNFEAGSNYPKSITYAESPTAQPRVVGTEIRNIAFTTKLHGVAEHRYMRAILMAGAVKLSQVRTYDLSQLCCSMLFGDERYVERCSFAPPSFAQDDENPDYNWGDYPQKIYAIDLEGGGDAMNLIGNHVATYSEKIGALKVRSCNGGTITGNILNSDVLIELCRGIDFAANHMEYGATVTVATSAVSVRDNYIWRGTRPAIILRRFLGDAYNLSHWSTELSNNQLFWRDQHTVGAPQAAQSVYPYDIRTDGYGTLDIHNTFHTSSRLGPAEGSYFGLMIEWMEMHRYEIVNNHASQKSFTEEDATLSPFEEFNNISHIASASSHIAGRRVTPMPATIIPADFSQGRDFYDSNPVNFLIDRHSVAEKDRWKKDDDVPYSCSYRYTAWMFADFKRKLLIPNQAPIPEQSPAEAIVLAPKYSTTDIQETQPTNDPDKYYNLRLKIGRGERSNYDIPAGPYWMYIERTAVAGQIMYHRKSVLMPISSACILWDDGEYLSGYEWQDLPLNASQAGQMEARNNLRPIRIIYHGTNVECLIDYDVTYLPDTGVLMVNGEWQEGDIIRRIGGVGAVARCWIFNGLCWDEI